MRVCVAVPHGGSVKGRMMTDVLMAMFSARDHISFVWAELEGTFSFHNRWLAAQQAIQSGSDYLWMVDADQTIPAGTLPKLINHNKDLVGAAYNYRRLPLMSTAKRLNEQGEIVVIDPMPTDLFECYSIGFGCVLIKVEALKRVPQPWFACAWDPVTGELIRTEDTWFCEQAAKVGIKTYCDPTLGVKHLGDFQY